MEEKSLKVRLYGDPVLKKKCKEVREFNEEIRQLINTMSQIMYQSKGVGLAASQIGVSKRVIVTDIGGGLISFVNPKIIWRRGKETISEGCLSFPGINLEIKRSAEVIVEGLNNRGKKIQVKSEGLLARVLQHEIDHLDGILIIDHVPKKRLNLIKEQLEEIKNRSGKV